MIEKSDSKWLSLATVPILGQPPRRLSDCVLLIFCKAPIAGQVKTRLQPSLTAEQAVAAHIQLTQLTLNRAFAESLCDVHLCCAPDSQHAFFQACAQDYPLTLAKQEGSDLGLRMLNAFKHALANYDHAIIIGCDCPSLTIGDIRQAFTALQNGNDVVIGPAADGGYVLIGLNEPHRDLFENMSWGTHAVASQTRQSAARNGLTVFELNQQWDVDYAEDWQRFLKETAN